MSVTAPASTATTEGGTAAPTASRLSSSGHNLAIAKASLSASLLRADPTSVNGDEITRFHALIDKCVGHCSNETVKECKDWVLRNIVTSKHRIAAFGKYMVALASSYLPSSQGGGEQVTKPSGRRRRLHFLYIVNDILHHSQNDSNSPVAFAETFGEFTQKLLWIATDEGADKQRDRLLALLDIWELKQYYPSKYLKEQITYISEAFTSKKSSAINDNKTTSQSSTAGASLKDSAVFLPPSHGSPTMPYYDLPVATMLPHLRPNSPSPINPRSIKPLPITPGPPRKALADAVQSFLGSVNKVWNASDIRAVGDVDEMGIEILTEDKMDYDDLLEDPNQVHDHEESYYGWTRGFAVKMMERRRLATQEKRQRRASYDSRDRGRGRSRSRSFSDSRSRSRSRSRSDSRSRRSAKHKRRDRDRSYSRSRSRSRRSRSRSYSRSRSMSRSRSGKRSRSRTRSRDRSRSHHGNTASESRSPRPPFAGPNQQYPPPPPPIPQAFTNQMPPGPIPPFPNMPNLPNMPNMQNMPNIPNAPFPGPPMPAQFLQAMASGMALSFPPPPIPPNMAMNFQPHIVPPPPPPQAFNQGYQDQQAYSGPEQWRPQQSGWQRGGGGGGGRGGRGNGKW